MVIESIASSNSATISSFGLINTLGWERQTGILNRVPMESSAAGYLSVKLFRISAEAIQTVKGRCLVAFRKRRIVEHSVDEVADFALQQHYRLTDVQQFRSVFPEDVHTQQFQSFAVKKKL